MWLLLVLAVSTRTASCAEISVTSHDGILFDYDACVMNVHGCSAFATCLAVPLADSDDRGYVCECNQGWSGNGFTCDNVDECQLRETAKHGRKKHEKKHEHNHRCGRKGATCVDTMGSFYCICDVGYDKQRPDAACTDIDECLKGTHNCGADANCLNAPGSFSCRCPMGFNGDGVTGECKPFCGSAAPAQRVDCFPEGNSSVSVCESRGCCFDAKTAREKPEGVPVCFYPLPANAYNLTSWKPFSSGATGTLTCSGKNRFGDGMGGNGRPPYHIGPFGSDVCPLELEVFYETDSRLRVRIRDPSKDRWEVPTHLFPHAPNQNHSPEERKYNVSYTSYPFGLAVTRQGPGGGEVVFNSTPVTGRLNGLSFEDQFISLSTRLSRAQDAAADESISLDDSSDDEPFLYGLAEHNAPFRLPVGIRAKTKAEIGEDKGKGVEGLQTFTLYARDRGGVPRHSAGGADGLYGSHPFFLQVSPTSGLSSGMLLMNSNAMDVLLATDSATFRVVGGIIDLYIFLGPSSADVVEQLTSVIGKPMLPPYWALGFHLCRWGYGSAAATRKVVEDMRASAIPHDVQWNDVSMQVCMHVRTYACVIVYSYVGM